MALKVLYITSLRSVTAHERPGGTVPVQAEGPCCQEARVRPGVRPRRRRRVSRQRSPPPSHHRRPLDGHRESLHVQQHFHHSR